MIVLEEIGALRARLELTFARLVAGGAAAVAKGRELYLDDVRPELGHDPRASRTGNELGDVQYAITRQHRRFRAPCVRAQAAEAAAPSASPASVRRSSRSPKRAWAQNGSPRQIKNGTQRHGPLPP